mmetsp:Transcript_18125/g.17500  ORF Transcript_18125/g.17500 Transcript_18125/m.17500 type:complete len:300 (-) Transcript_18125:390-1289(-)
MASLVHFFTGVGSAISVKLASSVDDVLWLSAFLTTDHSIETRMENCLVYFSVCILQTCLAYIISTSGTTAIDKLLALAFGDTALSTERILTLVSGSALGVYSIILAYEYYQEEVLGIDPSSAKDGCQGYAPIPAVGKNQSDEEDPPSQQQLDSSGEAELELKKLMHSNESSKTIDVTGTESYNAHSSDIEVERASSIDFLDVEETKKEVKEKKEARSLLVIAFLGSLDDLALFVPLLVGQTFKFVELVLGAIIATFIIICLCLFLVKCKFFADILQRVPIFAIVVAFSLALLFKGIFIE